MISVRKQPFQDISKTGKDRQWRERKLRNIELASQLEILGYRNFDRVYQCAETLKFVEQMDGTKKLYQSYFCKNKLCALCNWRRSMKYSYQASKIVEEAMCRHSKARFLFLTLTVRNITGQELNQAMKDILIGFNRLFKYKKVDRNMIGFLRATEVTYSKELDSYHPHLHVLLMVKPGYFRSKDDYLTQEEWTALWRKAMKLDYTPVVDIRAVKADKGKGLKGAILETAKYPVKPFDVIDEKTDFTAQEKLQIVDDMLTGLHRKRQIGFGKLFKDIKKELELDDLEDGNLVKTGDNTESRSTGREIVAIWNWERKNYYIKN
ncbi:plasmid rolling circle replication initiator protein [Streptococcus pneumoniae]|nr:plasmid rolling circle replication initiator protein [Streptococcus pneumoniae]